MAKGGGGFAGKPVKGDMAGKDYGKAVSAAARAKVNGKSADAKSRSGDAVAGRTKPVTKKTPTGKGKRSS